MKVLSLNILHLLLTDTLTCHSLSLLDGTVHDPAEDHAGHDHPAEEVMSSGSSAAHIGHSHGSESCDVEPMADFNMSMRIGSIFIILATSAVGIFAPIILYRISPHKEGSVRDWALTAGKFCKFSLLYYSPNLLHNSKYLY